MLCINCEKNCYTFAFLYSSPISMFELPTEITTTPLALIGLSGLDITSPVHRSIWDAFSNNRRLDSSAIQFKLLSPTHKFPTVKPEVRATLTNY